MNRLTGEFRTSWASADPLGVVDLTTFDYSDELLAAAGLHRDQFPELVAPGALLGSVTEDAARATGLPPGLPVVAGIGDGQSAQLGCGITEPGAAYLNLGTGIVSGTFGRTYASDVRFRTLAAGVPGAYTHGDLHRRRHLQHPLVRREVRRRQHADARAWTCHPSRCWRRPPRCCHRAAKDSSRCPTGPAP